MIEGIIQVTALALIALMFVSVMMGQKKAAREGFANQKVGLAYNSLGVEGFTNQKVGLTNGALGPEGFVGTDVITSDIPDVCAALMEDDCNKTKGCQFSRDVGLCIRRSTLGDKTAQAVLVRDIIEQFDSASNMETGPVPYNGLI